MKKAARFARVATHVGAIVLGTAAIGWGAGRRLRCAASTCRADSREAKSIETGQAAGGRRDVRHSRNRSAFGLAGNPAIKSVTSSTVGTTYFKEFKQVEFSGVTGGTVVTQGGVPEPAVWVVMLAGFGLAGTLLRRRSRALMVG